MSTFGFSWEAIIRERFQPAIAESFINYLSEYNLENITKEINLNIVLVIALMEVESNFNLKAVGDGGKAQGLFQLHQIAIDQVYKVKGYSWIKSLPHKEIYKYPLRQLQIALDYLQYWHSVGGVEKMLTMWNYTTNFQQKIAIVYEKYYLLLQGEKSPTI